MKIMSSEKTSTILTYDAIGAWEEYSLISTLEHSNWCGSFGRKTLLPFKRGQYKNWNIFWRRALSYISSHARNGREREKENEVEQGNEKKTPIMVEPPPSGKDAIQPGYLILIPLQIYIWL